jgi:hypothetical protein
MYFKFSGLLCWVCDSIVSVMNRLSAGLPRSCGLILVTSRLAGVHPASYSVGMGGYVGVSLAAKRLGYKIDCSLRSSSEVKIECNSTSIPP